MIPDELMLPIMEFIRRANEIPNLKAAVLFGSAVEGTMTKKSDIDVLLLFNTDHNPELGDEMKAALNLSGDIAKKFDLPYSFSFVAKNLNDPKDVEPDFLWTVAEKGILIWGKPDLSLMKEVHPSLEAMALVKFSLEGLPGKNRASIRRALYGYRVEKTVKGKTYASQRGGLVNKRDYRLTPGVVMVPASLLDQVSEILKRNGAKFKITRIWV
jgi:predicted nucleotidyltransferase